MATDSGRAALEAEVRTMRKELAELRAEQREMAQAIDQLNRTFRALASHLGIATEPYRKKPSAPVERADVPGFA